MDNTQKNNSSGGSYTVSMIPKGSKVFDEDNKFIELTEMNYEYEVLLSNESASTSQFEFPELTDELANKILEFINKYEDNLESIQHVIDHYAVDIIYKESRNLFRLAQFYYKKKNTFNKLIYANHHNVNTLAGQQYNLLHVLINNNIIDVDIFRYLLDMGININQITGHNDNVISLSNYNLPQDIVDLFLEYNIDQKLFNRIKRDYDY